MNLLVLSHSQVQQITSEFSPDQLVSLISAAFLHHTANRESSPLRTRISTVDVTSLFMPSVLPPTTAIKVVSVPTPSSPAGLPASTLVLDPQSGAVKAIVNARALTALRNAAGSLLSTRIMLADSHPTHMTLFGAGEQIAAHLSLFISAYPSLTSIIIVNRTIDDSNLRIASLKRLPAISASSGIKVSFLPSSAMEQIESAVASSQIIITATPSTTPLFSSKSVSPNTHLILIGSYSPSMHEVEASLLLRILSESPSSKILVDDKEACMRESGEIINAKLDKEQLIEVGEVLQNPELLEKAHGERVTMFKSVGLGVQDVAIAAAVVGYANEHSMGTIVEDYDI